MPPLDGNTPNAANDASVSAPNSAPPAQQVSPPAPSPDAPTPAPAGADPNDDPSAPLGRNLDGTPKTSKRGRPRVTGSTTSTSARQKGSKSSGAASQVRARLGSVSDNVQAPQPVSANPAASITAAGTIAVDYEKAGQEAAFLFFAGGMIVFGEDWAPAPDEEKGVSLAFTNWLRAKKMPAMSPDLALIIALGTYGAVRLQKPTVKTRAAKAWSWIKDNLRIGPKRPA